jgi:hypothetical protein
MTADVKVAKVNNNYNDLNHAVWCETATDFTREEDGTYREELLEGLRL